MQGERRARLGRQMSGDRQAKRCPKETGHKLKRHSRIERSTGEGSKTAIPDAEKSSEKRQVGDKVAIAEDERGQASAWACTVNRQRIGRRLNRADRTEAIQVRTCRVV
jgi:hypothetical protein